MWTCPKCNRTFRTTNQSHSCATIEIDSHFANKPAVIKEIYEKLLLRVNEIVKVNINVVKSAIFLKTSSTFIEIKPRKEYLLIAFYLDRELKEFPIAGTLQISKNRIVHEIHLQKPDDINRQVISLLKESYKLINGQ